MVCACPYAQHKNRSSKCEFPMDLEKHSNEVAMLLSWNMEMVTFIVGSGKQKLSCHKALLGYYSKYFYSMLFGSFPEASKDEIELDEDPSQLGAFIKWCYSGNIKTCHELIEGPFAEDQVAIAPILWVLGNRLIAPEFSNAAMLQLRAYSCRGYLNSATAEHMFSSTLPNHKLREYARDLITYEGPLCEDFTENYDTEAWVVLLAKGGDLVKECIKKGFHNNRLDNGDDEDPWAKCNEGKCLEENDQGSLGQWLEKKSKVTGTSHSS